MSGLSIAAHGLSWIRQNLCDSGLIGRLQAELDVEEIREGVKPRVTFTRRLGSKHSRGDSWLLLDCELAELVMLSVLDFWYCRQTLGSAPEMLKSPRCCTI